MLKQLIKLPCGIADLLYPPECPGCTQKVNGRFVCDVCRSTFRDAGHVVLTAELPRGVLPAVALWMFREQEPVQHILHRLKYSNCPWLGLEIGVILGRKLVAARGGHFDLVAPVPLHDSRRSIRGYNQSEWIARGVASSLGVPMAAGVLKRVRATQSQTTLSRHERLTNVEGAFCIGSAAVTGKNVVLIDDTVTTGATLMVGAAALVRAGAVSVQPAAAAAAPLRSALEPDSGFPVIVS